VTGLKREKFVDALCEGIRLSAYQRVYEVILFVCFVFQVSTFGWRGWLTTFLVSVSAEVPIFVT